MTNPFHELLLAHLPRLRRYALVLTHSASAADDLVQETALKALRAESQFIPDTNFSAWSYQIMRNTHISERRRALRVVSDIDALSEDHLAQGASQESYVSERETLRAINALPRRDRAALLAGTRDRQSYQDSARQQGCKMGTFKSRAARAKTKLQLALFNT